MPPKPTVGVAVITHNAKHHLLRCLPPYLNSDLKPKVLVVNSSSQDGTVEEAQRLGAETLVFPRKEFNHGATRERARKALGTDIAVMVTPDAYACDNQVLERLIQPLIEQNASVAYARQIAHDGAGFFEAFPRAFNYPKKSHVRSLEDAALYGAYLFFCSNSCCAWSNQALDTIGGFQPVLLGEDTIALSKLLRQGHKVAYQADAVVKHSHHYSLKQEFQRHFDTGIARKICQDLLAVGGSDTKRGQAFVKEMFKHLWNNQPHLLPYGVLHIMAKWTGYQTGRWNVNSPKWLKAKLSSQDFYWSSPYVD